ncbi:hypothetical protein lerEdw1_010363 [Lerista edwardsae]|nr:hypothetical protein lerEdw1_010363 [Lerista edwardsae]
MYDCPTGNDVLLSSLPFSFSLPRQPLSHPLHPSPQSPPFKLLLDRCRSLPLSQSTPMGLDQLGWKRRVLLATGGK